MNTVCTDQETNRLPRAVLFDAVGTLLVPAPPAAAVYAAAGRRHGAALDEATVHARFRTALARQQALDAADPTRATSEARERLRWQAIVAETFCELGDTLPLWSELWEHFARREHWRVDRELLGAVEALRAAGALVGLASNFDARLIGLCRGLALPFAPEHVFVSSLVGHSKPHRAFFAACARRLNLPCNQIAVVGDDLENDVRGARAAGMQGIWWHPGLMAGDGPSVDPQAGSADELLALLQPRPRS